MLAVPVVAVENSDSRPSITLMFHTYPSSGEVWLESADVPSVTQDYNSGYTGFSSRLCLPLESDMTFLFDFEVRHGKIEWEAIEAFHGQRLRGTDYKLGIGVRLYFD